MWIKYDYLCTDCDALIEITTLQTIPKCFEPECACGSANIINIGATFVTADEADSLKEPVTNITHTKLVKINTNPYT